MLYPRRVILSGLRQVRQEWVSDGREGSMRLSSDWVRTGPGLSPWKRGASSLLICPRGSRPRGERGAVGSLWGQHELGLLRGAGGGPG